MPNIAKILKDEIQRLARREVNQAIASLKKSTIVLKKTVAEQRQKIALLEKENRRLTTQQGKIRRQVQADTPGAETDDLRITGRQVRSLRSRLGISQVQLAKLIGVSGNIVTIWENKPGRLQLRKADVRQALADLKGLKKSQVRERIEKAQPRKSTKGRKKKRKK